VEHVEEQAYGGADDRCAAALLSLPGPVGVLADALLLGHFFGHSTRLNRLQLSDEVGKLVMIPAIVRGFLTLMLRQAIPLDRESLSLPALEMCGRETANDGSR
jgi:hypothetical protein